MGTSVPEGKRRILVVEDGVDTKGALLLNLSAQGYDVRGLGSGAAAVDETPAFDPDLVLLDLALPDLSVFEVCRRLRAAAKDRRPAIIILSARTDEIDRVVAFEVGADDYVTKPYSMRELLLRVRARLPDRQNVSQTLAVGAEGRRWSIGALEVDADSLRALVNGDEISLSPIEMNLLQYLAGRGGLVCSREDLLSHVWRYDSGTPSRTVDTHVKRLRRKLGVAGALVRTVRGKGYRIDGSVTKL